MYLKQIPAQKIRLALKMTGGVTVGLFFIGVIVKFLITGSILTPGVAHSEPCESSYTLDWGDPSTYTITCGDVNAANWSVKGMTCFYYSPIFNVGGLITDPVRTVDISVRINQSGNLDNNDTAWVYYNVNGVRAYTDMFLGGGSPAVFISSRTIVVPSAGNYQVSIKLMNDKSNELWQIKNGDVTACLNSLSPLPVQFASFTGTAGKKNVQLKWSTACEINNAYFTLERSADATNFFALAKVNGAGTSSSVHAYSFSDDSPLNGKSYYRLNQTDINGTSKTYKVISVLFSGSTTTNTSLHVSPNPFSDSFTAQFEATEKEEVMIYIISANGNIVITDKIMANEGNNIYRFSTPSNFKTGTYVLQILNGKTVIGNTKVICRKEI